jgi:hypothetical protein
MPRANVRRSIVFERAAWQRKSIIIYPNALKGSHYEQPSY